VTSNTSDSEAQRRRVFPEGSALGVDPDSESMKSGSLSKKTTLRNSLTERIRLATASRWPGVAGVPGADASFWRAR
jgi:hypothetical protein